jgi:hypothetical protein
MFYCLELDKYCYAPAIQPSPAIQLSPVGSFIHIEENNYMLMFATFYEGTQFLALAAAIITVLGRTQAELLLRDMLPVEENQKNKTEVQRIIDIIIEYSYL